MKKRKVLTLCLAMFLGITCISVSQRAYAERLSGNDRYETSIKISQKGWTSSHYVVLASGSSYADALCAVPFAKSKDAPIILTGKDSLGADTINEIKRLGSASIYIVGGKAVVSDNVVKQIQNELNIKSQSIMRLSGDNRFGTSAAVAKEMGIKDKVVFAYGYNYADALSIAAIAAAKGMPILLTDTNNLPKEDIDFVNQEKSMIKGVYMVGGTGVINETVQSEIDNLSGTHLVRLGGNNRYETNVNVLKEFQDDKDLNFNNIFIAVGDGPTGDEFADALSGAVLAAKKGAPLILTHQTLPDVTKNFLSQVLNRQTVITALGGEAVVPDSIVSAVNQIVANSSNNGSGSNAGGAISGGGGYSGGGSTGGGAQDQTHVYGKDPVTVKVTGNTVNVIFNDNGKNDDIISLKIYKKGDTETYKCINLVKYNNGTYSDTITLDTGIYDGVINTISKEYNLQEFQVN